MARKPFVSIIGPSERDIVGLLGDRLTKITIEDKAGSESDTLEFVVRVDPPFPAGPPEGTKYFANVGWDASSARLTGLYTVQATSIGGDVQEGYAMTVNCRAADFLDKMKAVDSGSFDNETVGSIFEKIAGQAGVTAVVDPELASIKIPYRLRWRQPALDFLDDLAREFGGTMKPAGGKLLAMKRGAKRSASGKAFAPIIVPFADSYGFSINMDSRGEYKDVGGDWFDPEDGILKLAEGKSIGDASRYLPVHPFASEDEAKRAGEAYGREEARKSVSGNFEMAGNAMATAEAPVIPHGFGSEIDSLDLVCSGATHEISFGDDGGWITSIDVESAGSKKARSKKGKGGSGSNGPDSIPNWQIPPGGENE